jgi:hypothetical protein
MPEMSRDSVVDLYARLRAQWNTRNSEYDLSRRRYYGEHWDPVTNPAPVNRYSLTANYLKPFIDKSVQLLFGRIPAIQVMPKGTDQEARRHAEQLEGVLYGTWKTNDAVTTFQKTAWDSFVLRRGIIYIWWDPDAKMVRFKNCAPEHFFPEYDGDSIYRAIYVSRRSTEALKDQYPELAGQIESDDTMNYPFVEGSDTNKTGAQGQTTVIDCFTADGHFYRVMGNAFKHVDLQLPIKEVPFIEFPCFPVSGDTEPLNAIDQLVELNQYVDQLLSQNADIISRYANPIVVDYGTGQSAEAIRRAMGSPGAVVPARPNSKLELLGWQGNQPMIMEQLQVAMDTLFDLAGKPRSAFGQQTSQQTGVQTNMSLTPTLQSNDYHESIFGTRIARLNEWILAMWEKNMASDMIEFEGRFESQTGSQKYYDVTITGEEIGGWRENRVKWPSAIRVDDPVYIQNNLQQLTSDPPAVSLYTYLERAGVEDVEAEIDRIKEQLEDPRLHPDRLNAAVDAASAVQGAQLPGTDFGGFAPDAGLSPNGGAPGAFADSMEAGANPNSDALIKSAKPSGY